MVLLFRYCTIVSLKRGLFYTKVSLKRGVTTAFNSVPVRFACLVIFPNKGLSDRCTARVQDNIISAFFFCCPTSLAAPRPSERVEVQAMILLCPVNIGQFVTKESKLSYPCTSTHNTFYVCNTLQHWLLYAVRRFAAPTAARIRRATKTDVSTCFCAIFLFLPSFPILSACHCV